MKKFFLVVLIFLFASVESFAAIACTPSVKGFVYKGKSRINSKLVLVCTGTTGSYTIPSAILDEIFGKRLYSMRAFPTTSGSVTDAADIKFNNSRGYDIFARGTGLIPTTSQVENQCYNDAIGDYWAPALDDENGYTLVVENLGGTSSFTVEGSLIE